MQGGLGTGFELPQSKSSPFPPPHEMTLCTVGLLAAPWVRTEKVMTLPPIVPIRRKYGKSQPFWANFWSRFGFFLQKRILPTQFPLPHKNVWCCQCVHGSQWATILSFGPFTPWAPPPSVCRSLSSSLATPALLVLGQPEIRLWGLTHGISGGPEPLRVPTFFHQTFQVYHV